MNWCFLASYIIFTFSHQNSLEQGIKSNINLALCFIMTVWVGPNGYLSPQPNSITRFKEIGIQVNYHSKTPNLSLSVILEEHLMSGDQNEIWLLLLPWSNKAALINSQFSFRPTPTPFLVAVCGTYQEPQFPVPSGDNVIM